MEEQGTVECVESILEVSTRTEECMQTVSGRGGRESGHD